MTTTDTAVALLRAIAQHPDEDTARLVYADYLDENGDPDRAEFIRVQCEAYRIAMGWHEWAQPGGALWTDLTERSDALLAAHRSRWLKITCPKCPKCGGSGRRDDPPECALLPLCKPCAGTGDLGGLVAPDWFAANGRGVVFRRGFPDEVRGCRLADCFEQRPTDPRLGLDARMNYTTPAPTWHPTPWLLRVLAHHPTLTRVPLVDRVPYRMSNDRYMWLLVNSALASALASAGYQTSGLPLPLWEIDEPSGRGTTGHDTAEAAVDALAAAVVTVGRAHLARGAA